MIVLYYEFLLGLFHKCTFSPKIEQEQWNLSEHFWMTAPSHLDHSFIEITRFNTKPTKETICKGNYLGDGV